MSTEAAMNKSSAQEQMIHQTFNENELVSSTISEDSCTPLSETVTTLASNVYKELERIIKNFGENSVKDLMPVMISTLESLDNALHDREVGKFEVESLKEQNEQLFQQYEREKSFHKEYQQRYLQVEDHLEEIKRENEEKLQSLESIVKIFEIKARNASDHISRLEEKENEMKQEYKRLHERYSELFKAHCDYMERTKILYGTDQLVTSSPSRGNLQWSNDKQSTAVKPSTDDQNPDVSLPSSHVVPNPYETTDMTQSTRNDAAVNTAKLTMMDEVSLKEFASDYDKSYLEKYKRGIFSKLRSLKLLSEPFDEQQFFVNEDEFDQSNNHPAVSDDDDDDDDISVDEMKNSEAFDKETRNENIDITDVDASADLFVRQSFYGMTKEVSNLIKENNELLETKNALNVLKDDLLVKIEELSNEQEILREEVDSLQTLRSRLQSRLTEVEEELRKTREEIEKKREEEKSLTISKGIQTLSQQQIVQENVASVSEVHSSEETATSKSLWRMFSDDWLPTSIVPNNILGVPVVDIQSDLREGTTQISEFFSGLFGGSHVKEASPKRSVTPAKIKHSATNDQIAPTINTEKNLPSERSINESSTIIDDDPRLELYGWSISSKTHPAPTDNDPKIPMNIPVPVYCRPIFNTNDKTQIWCAVGIDLNGLTADTNETSVDQLSQQLIESYHQMIDEQCLKLSSIVWIAAKANQTAMITILDSNTPEKVIETFTLGNAIVYAMGSVPGTSSTDYPASDNTEFSTSDLKITACTAESLSTSGNRSNTTKISELSDQTVDGKKTKYPTVWLGSSDGWLYLHSAIGDHRTTIGKVWLHHAIYSITHVRGRVFVSLANEKIIVFHRHNDGTWDLTNFHLILTGKSRESVRCAINVGETIWFGVANLVYILDVQTLQIRKQLEVHPRPEHSVQYMTCSGEGVWLSVRLSSALRLYHAQTFEHLQDVDIQPYAEKMIAKEKTGLYFVHISALTIACRRLWIGTGNGMVISIPLTENIPSAKSVERTDHQSSANYIPYCSMTDAQFSLHGYRDAVKFFVTVPGQPASKSRHQNPTGVESQGAVSSTSPFGDILVLSGGDGYIDFRLRNTTEMNEETSDGSRNVSYLIVWHLGST